MESGVWMDVVFVKNMLMYCVLRVEQAENAKERNEFGARGTEGGSGPSGLTTCASDTSLEIMNQNSTVRNHIKFGIRARGNCSENVADSDFIVIQNFEMDQEDAEEINIHF